MLSPAGLLVLLLGLLASEAGAISSGGRAQGITAGGAPGGAGADVLEGSRRDDPGASSGANTDDLHDGPSCAPQRPRTDCGYFGIQQAECESRGCCWAPTATAAANKAEAGPSAPAAGPSAGGGGGGAAAGDPSARPGDPRASPNDLPWCFHPNGPLQQPLYEVAAVEQDDGNATTRLLLRLRPGSASQPELGPDAPRLRLSLQRQSEARLYLRVEPTDERGVPEPRWAVPRELLTRPPAPTAPPASPRYALALPGVGEEFSLRVTRAGGGGAQCSKAGGHGPGSRSRSRSGSASGVTGSGEGEGEPLLHLGGGGGGCLVFKPQYLALRAQVPRETNLYGMGETTQSEGLMLRRDGSARALWNSDTPAVAVGVNLYGSHPVLYGITPGPAGGGRAWGWFLANSNAMELAAGSEEVEIRMTGGIIEMWIFAGPSPEEVSIQYQEVVGRPAMPPRWALGFHQSRYGYGSVDELEQVVASYAREKIPLEVVWSDIDYTDRCRMFTFDPQRYPEQRLRAFVDGLHAKGQRWVAIVDCGITALPGQGYAPYDRGVSYDIFIKDSTGRPLLGQVWSGPTHWPDFLHPEATAYWGGLLGEMYGKVPYDGIWLDMNEPSNFCTGECDMPTAPLSSSEDEEPTAGAVGQARAQQAAVRAAATAEVASATAAAVAATNLSHTPLGPGLGISCVLQCRQPSPEDPLSHPPYQVNNGNRRAPLFTNTLPLSAVGYGGVRQYDSHNLYALAEARVTHAALRLVAPRERPFILTRSTWSGSGRYAAHWSGDNGASWADLRRSVGALAGAALAGVAAAGADVCGFIGASSEQLCARWLSAGAFYTFVRDHSDNASPPQEAYRWPAAAQAARSALAARYSLLPYLYTAHYRAATRGGTVARPLAWLAPADPAAADEARSWLLGDCLMVAPVLDPDMDWVEAYFPGGGGTWCRLEDLGDCHTGPARHMLPAPLGAAPPLLLREGCVVPSHPAPGVTTAATAAAPLRLTALLAAAGAARQGDDLAAEGLLFADNGTAPDVGGEGSLRAALAAGASLATSEGWLELRVEQAPPPPPRQQQMSSTADLDVRQLVVDEVVVVGVPLPPGASNQSALVRFGMTVAVEGGAAAAVPQEALAWDANARRLSAGGLGLSAVRSFRLSWRAELTASGRGLGLQQRQGSVSGRVEEQR
ncbi:hypothetical protein HYH03_003923 [Edaphochlamys debaryana]|uniref:Maltase n=1 Tax=Edaphochlamys debaryana TaxID=47281 RepID=A0A835Y8W2_9CHLO|nr:hypothetical protein HYH03_003923 [Edaphochlamys debaryana]|eukprot:KAG2498166.1 hypothetical protein HYH03_003923 [Edaphochlamys debaryana]